MTVKELKVILGTIENDDLKVVMNGYYTYEVNGYFFGKNGDEDVLMLTNHNVQPRVNTK